MPQTSFRIAILFSILTLSATVRATPGGDDHHAGLTAAARHFAVEPLALSAVQDRATTQPSILTEASIEYQVTAGAWLARPGGFITFGPAGGATTLKLEEDLRVEDLETVPKVEVRVRKNQVWDLSVSGFGFETDAQHTFTKNAVFGSLTLAPGDVVQSSFQLDSAHLELAYSAWRPFRLSPTSPLELRFAPGVGIRYVSSELSITQNASATATADGEWAIPYISMLMEFAFEDRDDQVPLMESLRIDVHGGVGFALGGDGGGMAQIRAGLAWGLTEHIEFLFGYRLLELDVDDTNLNIDAGLQGLYLGGRVTF